MNRLVASFFLPILGAAAIGALAACGKAPGGPPPTHGTPQVGIVEVTLQKVAFTSELPGRTSPFQIAEVRPQVSGIVLTREFVEGSDVKTRQALYKIDPATYKAALDNDLATLAKAKATLTSLRLKTQRYKELSTFQAVSRQDYDDAISSLGQGEADVQAAQASVDSSRINLGYTRVDAPISGRISKSTLTPGALVTANQSTALATIQQLDPIYVDVTQPSAALLRFKRSLARGELHKAGVDSAKVRLRLEDGSLYPLEGKLEFSDVTVDPSAGSITIRALFPNPRAELLPGMYVRALLEEGVKENGLLVPQQAVARDSTGKPFAYVVGKDNKLQRRQLLIERAIGNKWLVSNGLQAGDKLVVDGHQRAAPDLEVTTAPWQEPVVPKDKASSSSYTF